MAAQVREAFSGDTGGRESGASGPAGDQAFTARLERRDLTLYDAIPAELSAADRRSLLALQAGVRRRCGVYTYLEIGSHLGGSLQPHLLDPCCDAIHSIDARPARQADARGGRFAYPGNSSRRMLENLERLSPEGVRRVHVYEADARTLDPAALAPQPDLVLIDGEHTDEAVQSDFGFVRRVAKPWTVVVFHDAAIVYGGLARLLSRLRAEQVRCTVFPLPDSLFVIVLGTDDALAADFAALAGLTGEAYLRALTLQHGYRRFHALWPFRALRWCLARLGLGALLRPYDYGDPAGAEPADM